MAKHFSGLVVSDKMQKTIVVTVVSQHMHPLYKKIQKRNKKYKVHVEQDMPKIGETVSFIETKPISKDKKYKLIKLENKK